MSRKFDLVGEEPRSIRQRSQGLWLEALQHLIFADPRMGPDRFDYGFVRQDLILRGKPRASAEDPGKGIQDVGSLLPLGFYGDASTCRDGS